MLDAGQKPWMGEGPEKGATASGLEMETGERNAISRVRKPRLWHPRPALAGLAAILPQRHPGPGRPAFYYPVLQLASGQQQQRNTLSRPPTSRPLILAMSALRILVPVKRVIDYAVGLPPALPSPSPRRGLRARSLGAVGARGGCRRHGCGILRANTAVPALNRSNRVSTRPRRPSRRPASSTA